MASAYTSPVAIVIEDKPGCCVRVRAMMLARTNAALVGWTGPLLPPTPGEDWRHTMARTICAAVDAYPRDLTPTAECMEALGFEPGAATQIAAAITANHGLLDLGGTHWGTQMLLKRAAGEALAVYSPPPSDPEDRRGTVVMF